MAVNRYAKIIEVIFQNHYEEGKEFLDFSREELSTVANDLQIKLPKNLGDIIYSFKYRVEMPKSIRKTAPEGKEWAIRNIGIGKYQFSLMKVVKIYPNSHLINIKIPDATPEIINAYALNDEQALLAKIRYNRLIDVFTGITCYSLQNHLRTTVKGIGQIETDEIYVGVDKNGVQYIIPVQAKGKNDKIGAIQIEQDIAMCGEKYGHLSCLPIAAQFYDDIICLFSFCSTVDQDLCVMNEKHYKLVPHDEIDCRELETYRSLQNNTE